jgi:ribosome-associated protein
MVAKVQKIATDSMTRARKDKPFQKSVLGVRRAMGFDYDTRARIARSLMISITPQITLDESEIELSFVRSSGPGGQNVNKVATAVQLRFDVARSPSLPDDVRTRLLARAGRKLTRDGVLVVSARRFRTQERNRADAIERLVEMIRAAATPPKRRRRTKPSNAARRKRVEEKRRRSSTKRLRGRPVADD